MRIAIFGAGAVGGYYGARLVRAGHDVHFIARGIQAEAMRRSGLMVRSVRGEEHVVPVQVTDNIATIVHADLVVIAVKLWDTESAAQAIRPVLRESTAVMSLQNGIDKDDRIAGILGRQHVVGGVTYIQVNQSEPGVIVHAGSLQRVLVGELDGGCSDRVNAIVGVLLKAGIDGVASVNIRRDLWEKFVFLAAVSAVTTVTRQTIGVLRAQPATRALLRDAMAEIVAVARVDGVHMADEFLDEMIQLIDSLPPEGRSSMANDLLRNGRLELEWLSGAVVKHGERAGVNTPVHRTLMAALIPFANGAKLGLSNQEHPS